MKNKILLLAFFFAAVGSFITPALATIVYTPNASRSMTSTKTYCQNATATNLAFRYRSCTTGMGSNAGTPITITWYQSLTNATTGGTPVSVTTGTSALSTSSGYVYYTPSTATVGIFYYYCVITWDGSGKCNTAGTLTSATTTKVTVKATPAAITGTTGICTGATTTLNNTSANGTWTSSNTAVATVVSSTHVVTGVAAGTARITYTTGCGTAATAVVTVSNTPTVAAITGTPRVCTGSTTTLANATTGGTWSSSATGTATVGTSGIVTGVASGTATISYIITNSCSTAVATTIVTVATVPSAITGASVICNGYVTAFTNTTTYGTWSSANSSVATVGSSTGSVTGTGSGNTTISYTTGCGTAATKALTVNGGPAAITGTTVLCIGNTSTLSNASAGGTWSSSNIVVATINPSTGFLTAASAGTTTISYSNGSCSALTVATVGTTPSAITGTSIICSGTTTTYTNTIGNGAWTSSNTGVATVDVSTGIITGIASGTSNITYSTGCGSAVTKTISVNSQPAAITGSFVVCQNLSTTLTNTVSGGAWTSSNTATGTINATSGSLAAIAAGTSTISYTIGICRSTATITVNPAAVAGTITGALSICDNDETTLTATGTGDWISSDDAIATIDDFGLMSAQSPGTVIISYIVTNSCGSSMDTAIATVIAAPDLPNNTGTLTVCPATTTILANTTNGGTWTSSNTAAATVGSTGIVTGVAAGTATISYTVTNTCGSDVAESIITTNALPAAGTITGTATVCQSATITLTNATTGGVWTSANTSVATVGSTGIVTGAAAGTATISYSVTNSCGTAVTTKIVTVNALANAGTITGTATVCPTATTALNNATTGGVWTSANTSIATIGTTGIVTGVAAGTATISYAVTNICNTATTTKVVTVNALATAGTITGTAVVCPTATISLNNATTGGVWTSANTSIATVGSTGTLTGVAAGTATISYAVTNTCNTAVTTKIVTVNPLANAGTITGTTTVCVSANITLNNATTGGTWTSANTSVATIGSTGIVSGVAAGTATISYAVTNGCNTAVATTVITVNALATAGTITGTATVCAGSSTSFTNVTAGGVWSSANSAIATAGSTGTISGVAAGTATISYAVTTTCNTAVTTKIVTVNAVPSLTIPSSYITCNGTTQSAAALSSSVAGTTYSWTNNNTSVGLPANGNVTICATATEDGTLVLSAPAGSTFISVDFASYGTPTGSCGSFATGSCHAANSLSIVQGYVLGQNAVTIPATNAVFGDPCSSTTKRLYVQATYANPSAGVIPSFVATNSGTTPVATTVTVNALANGCPANPATFSVTVNPSPAAYTVTGGGAYCSGGTGTTIGLSNSQTGINYQLKSGAFNIGSAVAGTGSAISFGLQTAAGTYSVLATNTATTCSNAMTGAATVTINPIPNVITPANQVICNNNTQNAISLTGSVANTSFNWTNTNTSIGLPSSGAASGTICGTAGENGNIVLTAPAGAVFVSVDFASYGTPSGSCGSFTSGSCHVTNSKSIVEGYVLGQNSATIPASNGIFGDPCSGVGKSLYVQATYAYTVIPAFTAVNTGTTPVIATVTVTPSAKGCTGTPGAFTITVNPSTSVAAITGGNTICAGNTTALSNTTAGGTWSSSNTAIATVGSASGIINAIAAGNATISYAYTNTCGTATATKSITVNPLPNAGTIAGATTIYTGGTGTLTNTAVGGTWSSSNTTVATIGTSGTISGITAGTTVITYTYTNSCGTAATTASVNVIVPSVISGAHSVCEGSATTLTNNVPSGTWNSSNPATASINATTGIVTGLAAGITTISYTSASGIATYSFTVNSTPAAITGSSAVCIAQTTTLSTNTTTGTWSSNNITVATISTSNGIVSGIAAGVANITYTEPTGCSIATTITVNPLPAAITGATAACNGASFTLTNTTTGGTWSTVSTVATVDAASGIVTGIMAGTAVITYTTENGCIATKTVTINAIPADITGTTEICRGYTTTLSNTATGGTWSSNNTLIATVSASTGVVTGVAAGTANITYTTIAGCTTATTVTINPIPSAITGTLSVCTGRTTTLSSMSAGGLWSSNNTAIAAVGSATGIVTGMTAGSVVITYTLPTGCKTATLVTVNTTAATVTVSGAGTYCTGATITAAATSGTIYYQGTTANGTSTTTASAEQYVNASGTYFFRSRSVAGCWSTEGSVTVSVNPIPAAITGGTSICAGTTSTLNSTTVGGIWSIDNASVATINSATGVVTGINAGSTNITYSIAGGCTTATSFIVNAQPSAFTGTTNVCQGLTTTYSYLPTGGNWTSGNTSVATVSSGTGVITGIASGAAAITYNTANGCTAINTVSVNALPAAITGTAYVCAGAATTLANATGSGTWSSSNTSIATINATNGQLTGVAAGTAYITYTLPTGCKVHTTATVYPLPATVSVTGAGSFCGSTVISAANGNNGTIYFQGTTAGGTSTVNPATTATITTSGTYYFRARSASGCWGSEGSANVTINEFPETIDGITNVCAGSSMTLGNATTGGAWSSSNTAVATVSSATGVVSGITGGTATISYTMPSGCNTSLIITVNQLPGTTTGTATTCVGSSTTLTNSTPGGAWSSSAATVSVNETTGTITGLSAGTARITYTTGTGCFNTSVITVNASPSPITGTSAICTGASGLLSNSVTGGTWTVNNTSIATVSGAGNITGVAAGTALVTYSLYAGCRATSVITVNPAPASIAGILSVCTGTPATLSNTVTGGTWASNNSSVATIGGSNAVVNGISTGTAAITYTLPTGCKATTYVTVNPAPTAITGTATMCAGNSTTLSNTTTGGAWNTTSTIATVSAAGIVTSSNSGSAIITYTMPSGCTATKNVVINAIPSAISGSASICLGTTSVVTNTTAGGLSWTSSTPSVATVGASSGVVTGIAEGVTNITYTVSTGCYSVKSITVNPAPAAITGTANICMGTTATLSNTTDGGTWSSSSVAASIGSATGIVSGYAAGTSVITYKLPSGCQALAVVTVSPLPSAITGTANTCVGLTSTLANATIGGTWSSSNTAIATVGTSGITTGISAGSAVITYTLPTGCQQTTVFNVNQVPSAITGATLVCAGSTSTLSNSVPGGVWTSGSSAIATVTSAAGLVTAVSNGAATITYSMGTACRVITVVTVSPIQAITGTTIACVGLTTSLMNATTGGTWNSSNPAVATVGASTGIVTGIATGSATITYSIGTGCARTTVVTINPTPAAITGNTNICAGLSATLSNTITGGAWTTSASGIATVSTAGVVTGINAGTARISYSTGTGCIVNTTVTINPSPAAIGGTTNVCEAATTTLSNTITGGAWTCAHPSLATISATGVVYGVAAGVATVSYTLTGGCAKTAAVTVKALPAAISGAKIACVGGNTVVTDLTSGGLSWTIANSAIATVGLSSGLITGVAAGTTLITYTLTTGCYTTAVVTINPNPSAIVGVNSLCVGSNTALSSSTSGGTWSSSTVAASIGSATGIVTGAVAGTSVITYKISNGCQALSVVSVTATPAAITGPSMVCVGSTATLACAATGGTWSSSNTAAATIDAATGLVSGMAAGTTTISYTITGGCARTLVLTISTPPAAITGTTTVCTGATTTLANSTSGGTWTSGSTAGIASINTTTGIVTGLSAGTAVITYTSANGCTSTTSVNVLPVAGAISGTTSLCIGNAATLTNAIADGTWTSSNTSVAPIDANGTITAVAAGTTSVTYTPAAGCAAMVTISVNPVPSAITGNTTVCTGSATTLSNASTGNSWSSSNTAVATVGSTSGTVTGVTAGTAIITFTATTGCNVAAVVTVNETPSTITGSSVVCQGSSTIISSATAGGTWSSTNPIVAVISASGSVTGLLPGNATISYTVANGCSVATNITINPSQPISGAGAVCAAKTITLGNTVAGGAWSSSNSGIAAVASTGVLTGVATGNVVITYTLPTGCVRTAAVTVNPVTTISGTQSFCLGNNTTLSSSLTGGAWNSANVSMADVNATTGLVTGYTDGTVNITYTMPTGCASVAAVTINPIPSVVSGTTSVCTGGTTALGNTLPGGTWSSSNTAAAVVSLTSGVVTGVASGSAIITYTMATGCSRSALVTVLATPAAITSPGKVCIGSSIAVTNPAAGNTWTSSNTSVATVGVTSGIVTGITTGTVAITYTSYAGCTTSTVLTVMPVPAAITGLQTICIGGTTTLADATPAGTWSSATAIVDSNTGVVYGTGAGTTLITYTIANGCTRFAEVTVNPIADITGSNDVCEGATTILTNAYAGGTWSIDDATVATINSTTGAVSGIANGLALITYTAPGGCSSATYMFVNSLPPAITGTMSLLAGTTTTLNNVMPGGEWTSSNIGIAPVSAVSGVVTGVSAGNATITYTLTTGCSSYATVTVDPASKSANTNTAANTAAAIIEIRLFPNPNNGRFSVTGSTGSETSTEVTVDVTDMLGQVVSAKTFTAVDGKISLQMTLDSALANGMYIFNMKAGNVTKSIHFIIQQ